MLYTPCPGGCSFTDLSNNPLQLYQKSIADGSIYTDTVDLSATYPNAAGVLVAMQGLNIISQGVTLEISNAGNIFGDAFYISSSAVGGGGALMTIAPNGSSFTNWPFLVLAKHFDYSFQAPGAAIYPFNLTFYSLGFF